MAQARSRFHVPSRRPRRTPTDRGDRPDHEHRPTTAPEVSMESHPEDVAEPVESSVVDAAIYRDGQRIESPSTVAQVARHLHRQTGVMAWIGMFRPTEAQLLPVARVFELHELAVEDAVVAHQRPKVERYGDTLFVVLRAATYLDDVEEVEFGEIHVFVGPDFVITVRHSRTPDLAAVRHRMEDDPELLAHGPMAVLYAILDSLVDGYAPV